MLSILVQAAEGLSELSWYKMTFNKLEIWFDAKKQYSRFFGKPLDNSYMWNSASDNEFARSFMPVAQVSSCDK